jgi:nucleoid-associated protein YgaU
MLAPQKVTKEEGTQPSRPSASLRCSTKWASIETRPSGLQKAQATAELEQPMADFSHFVSATQRDGMGFISPNSHCINVEGSKTRFFS